MKRILLIGAIFARVDAMENLALVPQVVPQEPTTSLCSELQNHVLEISIASLYLAGAVPFFSETTRWGCDIAGSLLWLTTSIYACIMTVRKRTRARNALDVV